MFTLPQLSYQYNALEPHIDARTMEIHHTKHHQAYLNKLNAALENEPALQTLTIEKLLTSLDQVPVGKKDIVKNHGGGHYNHSLFWEILTPDGSSKPTGDLLTQINTDFGSVDQMVAQVSDAANTHFGSGWGWLVVNQAGKLEAISTANQDAPILYGYQPLLGIDVWEHAYYLKYQNLRPDYVKAFWNVVNWDVVAKRFAQIKAQDK